MSVKESGSRLRWQCRRGMRELDELLTGYLERDYPTASEAQKSVCREFLELPDPVLAGYLLQREPADSTATAELVRVLLRDPLR
jgi:antitoxin CptB